MSKTLTKKQQHMRKKSFTRYYMPYNTPNSTISVFYDTVTSAIKRSTVVEYKRNALYL